MAPSTLFGSAVAGEDEKKTEQFLFLILLSTTAIVNSFAKITKGYNWSLESIINSCTCKLVNCDLIRFLLSEPT